MPGGSSTEGKKAARKRKNAKSDTNSNLSKPAKGKAANGATKKAKPESSGGVSWWQFMLGLVLVSVAILMSAVALGVVSMDDITESPVWIQARDMVDQVMGKEPPTAPPDVPKGDQETPPPAPDQAKETPPPDKPKETPRPEVKDTGNPQNEEEIPPLKTLEVTPPKIKETPPPVQVKETPLPEKQEVPLPKTKETPPKVKETPPSPQENPPSEKKKEVPPPKTKETPPPKKKETPPPAKIKETPPADQKKEDPAPKTKETPPKVKETPSPPRETSLPEKKKEVPSPKTKETPPPKIKETPPPAEIKETPPVDQKKEDPAPKTKETPPKVKETPSPPRETPPPEKKKEVPPPKTQEIPPPDESKKSSTPEQKAKGPPETLTRDEAKRAPEPPKAKETPPPKNKETQPPDQVKKASPSPEKAKETVPPETKETPPPKTKTSPEDIKKSEEKKDSSPSETKQATPSKETPPTKKEKAAPPPPPPKTDKSPPPKKREAPPPEVVTKTPPEDKTPPKVTEDGKEKPNDEGAADPFFNTYDRGIMEEILAADKLLQEKKTEAGMRKFESLLMAHPGSPRVRYGRAQAMDQMAEEQRSNEFLKGAITAYGEVTDAPDCPPELKIAAVRRQANRMSFMGKTRFASEKLKSLSEEFPDNIDIIKELGVFLLIMGDNAAAQPYFEKALEFNPNEGFSKVHLGFIHRRLENYEAAIPLLEEGIASNEEGTGEGKYFFNLGDAYLRTGRPEEALRVYEEATRRGLFLSPMQRSLYNVNSLRGQPWWTPKEANYEGAVRILESNWKVIRGEAMALMNKETKLFEPEDESLRETGDWKQFTLFSRGAAIMQYSDSHSLLTLCVAEEDGNLREAGDSKQFTLFSRRGKKHEKSCERAPKTCQLFESIPESTGCKRGQVKFSVMHPGTHVWPHTGPTNCRLRSHLGLVVPPGTRIRVVNETRTWEEGKVMIFDDSFEHEVWQEAESYRMVLISDLWHPELTEKQRKYLTPI